MNLYHHQNVFIFRFVDGFELGLGGIQGWDCEDGNIRIYDKHGICLAFPQNAVRFFMPKPDPNPSVAQTKEGENAMLEANQQVGVVPNEAKDAVLKEAKAEAARFIMRDTGEVIYFLDTEAKDDNWTDSFKKPNDPKAKAFYEELIRLANVGHEAEKTAKYEKAIQEEALTFAILDGDVLPAMSVKKDVFDGMLQRGEYRTVSLPVVINQTGEYFRFELTDERYELRRCTLKTGGKLSNEPAFSGKAVTVPKPQDGV